MARYRGRHRAPSTTKQALARTAVAGAVLGAPVVLAPAASATPASTWDALAQCESSGNWAINTGNGFRGGLQFTNSTWRSFGGVGVPEGATREQQIAVAERVLAVQGWGAWPACSRKLGLRGRPAVHDAPQATPSTSVAPTPTAAPLGGGGPAGTVTVAPGDTLADLAAAHHVVGGWKALRAANPDVHNPNVLRVGQVLHLP